jgi:hypothetical protein
MEAWYGKREPLQSSNPLNFHSRTEEQTIDDKTFLMLFANLEDHTTRAIALEKTPSDYKIDWESYVAWSEIPWSEFVAKEPTEPNDFRVVIQHDTYYNFFYADEARYFCYKLIDPENSAHCFAYTGLDSDAGQKINRMIRRQRHAREERVKAILKLHFEQAARGHLQAWIDDVVQDGWVKTAP